METIDHVFRALGDPLRRHLLDILLRQEKSVSELCALFPVSQPAISQHLKVLREAGLVRERYEGRRRIYAVELEGVRLILGWVQPYESAWQRKFARLGRYLSKRRDG